MSIANRRHFLGAAALMLTLLPSASADERLSRPSAGAEVWVRTELYFGTNKSNGTVVSDADFAAFGRAPGRLIGVGILTDSDNTGAGVEAFYGDIRLLSALP